MNPLRNPDLLLDGFLVTCLNPLLDAGFRKVRCPGKFRRSSERDYGERIDLPMSAQLLKGRELSNLLDSQFAAGFGERCINSTPNVLVLLDSFEKSFDCAEEVDIAVNVAEERLVQSEFARKDEA